MASLVPFNKNGRNLRTTGFNDRYNMLDNFFEDSYTPFRTLARDTFKVDVQDNEKEFVIEAELPGVSKEEVSIEMSEGKLSIGIDRSQELEEEKKNYIHRERRHSSMQRCIYLRDADTEEIEARLENGILTVKVAKIDASEKVKKIDIK